MKTKILTCALLGVFLISLVSALGVSSPYWGDNPLQLHKGESRVVDLNLQNMVGDEDITLQATITQGSEIASLSGDNTYSVKAGTSDTIVPLTVRLPGKYEQDSTHVEVEFRTVSSGEGGTVAFGTGMVVGFQVVSLEREGLSTTAWVIIIIAILAIIIILLRKKKK